MRYGYMPFAHFTQCSRSYKLWNHLRPALSRHPLMNDLDSLESESVWVGFAIDQAGFVTAFPKGAGAAVVSVGGSRIRRTETAL